MARLLILLAFLQVYHAPALSQNVRVYTVDSTSDQTMQVPQTPCPRFFQYQYGASGWTGLIAVPPPNTDVSLRNMIPIKLEVQLRVFGLLPSKYVGRLELAESKNNVLQKILSGDSSRGMILYRLYFPNSSNLPWLMSIGINGNIVCTGAQNVLPTHGRIITSITLEHTFYPSANALNVESSLNNNNGGQYGNRHNFNQGQSNFPQQHMYNGGQGFNQGSNFNLGQNGNIGQNQDQNFNGGFYGENFGTGNQGFQNVPSTNMDQKPSYSHRPQTRPRPEVRPQIQGNQNLPRPQNAQRPQIAQNPPQEILEPIDDTIHHELPDGISNSTPSAFEQDFLGGQYKACGKPLLSNHLVAKGKKVKKGSWPWLAALFRKYADASGLRFTCGGTLVSEEYVITAAHCVAEEKKMVDPDRLLLYLGKFNLESWTESDVQPKDVRRIIVHPDYKALGSEADIALLQLSSKAEFNQFVQPACIWPSRRRYDGKDYTSVESLVGKLGTVTGWGRDELGNKVTNEPRSVKVPVVSQADCFNSHLGLRHFTSNRTLCAGSRDGSGPCNGDSGGGLMFLITDNNDSRWFLRGIVSLSLTDIGRMCDLKNYIVYTDVAKFGEWLSMYMPLDWVGAISVRTDSGWGETEEEMNPDWDPIPFTSL
ncbi:serine protease gd-like isoform X2 [Ischnura elegans]|uniref:serine protease gd-like isoform X2 n=1 Tax=Ischnura elegans TaxID=197161 RepID=UPI001ED89183|nr:serine protease gd-like isoform X2 [Ischnura elegans]